MSDTTIFMETKRLLVLHPTLADFDKIYALDRDPDVMQFHQKVPNRETSYEKFMKSLHHYERYGFSFGMVYEKASNEFIGQSGMIYSGYNDESEVHLGIRLH